MAYEEALRAAGAKVLAFQHFGSYQGDWLAKVEYEGRTFLLNGSYGSCSGCDAFEAEFGWHDEQCESHRYGEDQPLCLDCQAKKADYQTRLAAFGRGYLNDPRDRVQLITHFQEQAEWDMDAQEIITWLEGQ